MLHVAAAGRRCSDALDLADFGRRRCDESASVTSFDVDLVDFRSEIRRCGLDAAPADYVTTENDLSLIRVCLQLLEVICTTVDPAQVMRGILRELDRADR